MHVERAHQDVVRIDDEERGDAMRFHQQDGLRGQASWGRTVFALRVMTWSMRVPCRSAARSRRGADRRP